MIDLYYAPTPNGWKVTIMLEECGLAYRVVPIDLQHGEQYKPGFLAINPNSKIPAIVDRDGEDGPQTVFESGAILLYLALKAGRFLPVETRPRTECFEWLFWQVSGLGPVLEQANYFRNKAPEHLPAVIERTTGEAERLLGVMDGRLATREYLAGGAYSVADIACWGWIHYLDKIGLSLAAYSHLQQWRDHIGTRSAVRRGVAVGADA